MPDFNDGRPSEAMISTFIGEAAIPTAEEMDQISARAMNVRLGGRPALRDDERKKTTSVSLSPRSLAYLSGFEETSRLSRSEIIELLIELNRDDPGPLVAALRGERRKREALTDAEVAAIAKVASDAIAAWSREHPSKSLEEMRQVVQAMYAAAADSVRVNR